MKKSVDAPVRCCAEGGKYNGKNGLDLWGRKELGVLYWVIPMFFLVPTNYIEIGKIT